MSLFKKHVLQHRNNKLQYYLNGFLRELYPPAMLRAALLQKLSEVRHHDIAYIKTRIDHYNKMQPCTQLPEMSPKLSDLTLGGCKKVYYFDAAQYARYFSGDLCAHFLFGDVTHVPDVPTIVKTRPIAGENANSVLMKLNKVRHFVFVKDDLPFARKKDQLVWRGIAMQEQRVRFLERYFDHPMCNLGKINRYGLHAEWFKGWLSMNRHLQYKFILSLEGNDVATNLKWIMSSNSVAVMPRPRFESWFMEGTLKPDYHYIEINDDYSDLEEKLAYYLANPADAEQIRRNANEYVLQFKNKAREDLMSLLVLEKYFVATGQIERVCPLI